MSPLTIDPLIWALGIDYLLLMTQVMKSACALRTLLNSMPYVTATCIYHYRGREAKLRKVFEALSTIHASKVADKAQTSKRNFKNSFTLPKPDRAEI